MLALPAHGFVMLSLPKCASTSMVKAVAGQAEMVLRINPKLKHINCAQFHELMVPVLRKGGYQRKDYEVVSLFREPVEWLESWWRYRKRPALSEENSRRFTGDQSFEEFTIDYLERKTKVGGWPACFIAMSDDLDIGVDRLFALERPEAWQGVDNRQARQGTSVSAPTTSPPVRQPPELLPATRARLEEYFAPEYDIYSHLSETGTWAPPKGYVPDGSDLRRTTTRDRAPATARTTIRSISSSHVGRSSIRPTT